MNPSPRPQTRRPGGNGHAGGASTLSQIGRGLGSLLVLLLVLVGAPVVLLRVGRLDVLGHLGLDDLTRAGDAGPIILLLLTLLGWASWALVAATVVSEVVWVASRCRVRIPVPGGAWLRPAVGVLVVSFVGLVVAQGTRSGAGLTGGGGSQGSGVPVTSTASTGSPVQATGISTSQPSSVASPDPEQATGATAQQGTTAPARGRGANGASASSSPLGGPASQHATNGAGESRPRQSDQHEPAWYIVQPHDDLWALAHTLYDDPTQWRQLARANRIGAGAVIQPGDPLCVPHLTQAEVNRRTGQHGVDTSARTVVVRAGDTLASLAERHLGSAAYWPALQRANATLVLDADHIDPGWVLHLPPRLARVAGGAVVPDPPRSATPDGSNAGTGRQPSATSAAPAGPVPTSSTSTRSQASEPTDGGRTSRLTTSAPSGRRTAPVPADPGAPTGGAEQAHGSGAARTSAGRPHASAAGASASGGPNGSRQLGGTSVAPREASTTGGMAASPGAGRPPVQTSSDVATPPDAGPARGASPSPAAAAATDRDVVVAALAGLALSTAAGIMGALRWRRRGQGFARPLGRRPARPEAEARRLEAALARAEGTIEEPDDDPGPLHGADGGRRGLAGVSQPASASTVVAWSRDSDSPALLGSGEDAPVGAPGGAIRNPAVRDTGLGAWYDLALEADEPRVAGGDKAVVVELEDAPDGFPVNSLAGGAGADAGGLVECSQRGASAVVVGETPTDLVCSDLVDAGRLVVVGSIDLVRESAAALALGVATAPWSRGVDVHVVSAQLDWLGRLDEPQLLIHHDLDEAIAHVRRAVLTDRENERTRDGAADAGQEIAAVWLLDLSQQPPDEQRSLLLAGCPRSASAGQPTVWLTTLDAPLVRVALDDLDPDDRGDLLELRDDEHAELTGVPTAFRPSLVAEPARRALVELFETASTIETEPAPWWAPNHVTAARASQDDASWNEQRVPVGAAPGLGVLTALPTVTADAVTTARPGRLSLERRPDTEHPENAMARIPESLAHPDHPTLLLLGEVELLGARGSQPTRARKQCLEYCAWLLANPRQTAVTMTRSLLVAETTRRSNMSRLRTWLGRTEEGEDYLPDAYSGRIQLHPAVTSDWEYLQLLISAGVNRASDDALVEALELVRGAPLADAAPGQWHWAEELRTQMCQTVRDIGLLLAQRALDQRDIDLARWAACRGLVVEPEDELLLAMRIRTEHAAGNRPEVERLVLRVTRAARDLGVDLTDDTVLLLQQVMEGRVRARA